LKECGQKLGEVTPRGLVAVFERLRVILHEEKIEKRVQYMIEVSIAVLAVAGPGNFLIPCKTMFVRSLGSSTKVSLAGRS